jgi:hypothetical protein
MQTGLRAATLTLVGVVLGGCESIFSISPYLWRPTIVTVSEQDPDVARPQRVTRSSGEPRLTKKAAIAARPTAAVSKTPTEEPGQTAADAARPQQASASTPAPGSPSPQTSVEPEVTGAAGLNVDVEAAMAAAAAAEQRRKQQLEGEARMDRLNQSASRAIRSICSGC